MRYARSTQQKESELRNSRSCHICLKKQPEKNAACTVNSAERALWAARADSPPLNRILKDQVTNWKKSSSILKIIPLTKLLRCELERLNKETGCHIYLVPACHVFESTFKNQASTALEEVSSQLQDQASTALDEITRIQKILQPSSRSKLWKVNKRNKTRADSPTTKAEDHLPHEAPCEISSPIQDQASTALETISSPIQDRASMARGSTSTVRDFKTHLLHVTSTCTRRALKWGHFSETPKLSSIQVPEESRKCSSFFVHRSSKIKPRRPLDQQSSTFKIKPRRPLKKAFFVLRSSFFQDQAPTALWINNHPPIQDQAPTALEESTIVHHPFIQDQAPTALWINNVDKSTHPTVLQDQAQKPLKIRSSLFFKIKPKSPWRSVHHCSSKIKPKSPFEDPLKSTFKIKSTALEERSSLDQAQRPFWINRTSTNTHLTEIESEDQNRERL
ncbi:hypothetical protein PS2_006695 [Malus domestica]